MGKIPKNVQKSRVGLSVQNVLDILTKIEDKTKPCCIPTIGLGMEMEGIKEIKETTLKGYAGSYLFEETETVTFM